MHTIRTYLNALLVAGLVILPAAGCSKKEDSAGKDTPAETSDDGKVADETKPDEQDPEGEGEGEDDEVAVVVPEDFEEEVQEEITSDNLEKEVKELEDELLEPEPGKEPAADGAAPGKK